MALDDPRLRELNTWYRLNVGKLGIKNQAYSETRAIRGIIIVDRASADPSVPDLIPVPIDADHISICKLDSRESLVYVRVRAFIVHFAQPEPGTMQPEPSTNVPLPPQFGTQPTRDAISILPVAKLRRLLTQRLQLEEVKVIWFDTFGDGIENHLPGKPLRECVVGLLIRARNLQHLEQLYEAIALERPDLGEELKWELKFAFCGALSWLERVTAFHP